MNYIRSSDSGHEYFDPVITLSDDGCEYPLRYAASDDAIRSLYTTGGINLGNSPFERTPGEMNCTVATGNLHIDPFGNLQPCVQWKESIDNIRNRPVAEIWETNPRLKQIREMNAKVLEDIKGATPHYDFCLHCPGLSLLRYGDPTRPEEQYLRVARIRSEIRDAGNGAPDGLPEPSEGGG